MVYLSICSSASRKGEKSASNATKKKYQKTEACPDKLNERFMAKGRAAALSPTWRAYAESECIWVRVRVRRVYIWAYAESECCKTMLLISALCCVALCCVALRCVVLCCVVLLYICTPLCYCAYTTAVLLYQLSSGLLLHM